MWNDKYGVLKPSICTSSNPPDQASPQFWKPISELNLELESSVWEMSSVDKMSPSDKTLVFVTHDLVKQDSSVGSSSSYVRSRIQQTS